MTIPRVSQKRLKKLGGKLPFSTISKKPKPIRKVNPKAKAKRDKRYKAHLSSAYWKALRREAWRRTLTDVGLEYPVHCCENCGDPLDDIRDMQLAHLTYARFGHELIEDVSGQCKQCNQTEAALRGKRIPNGVGAGLPSRRGVLSRRENA